MLTIRDVLRNIKTVQFSLNCYEENGHETAAIPQADFSRGELSSEHSQCLSGKGKRWNEIC